MVISVCSILVQDARGDIYNEIKSDIQILTCIARQKIWRPKTANADGEK